MATYSKTIVGAVNTLILADTVTCVFRTPAGRAAKLARRLARSVDWWKFWFPHPRKQV